MRIIAYAVYLLLNVVELTMIARAILSWIPGVREGKVMQVLVMLTEPFIAPVRSLLSRVDAIRNMPIDLSFLIVFLILQVLSNMMLGLIY